MVEESYRVILTGYGSGKGEHYIEEAFAKLFKITLDQAKQVLKEVPKTLKENLTLDVANKYKAAIDNTGAKCDIENMRYDTSKFSLE